LQRLPPPADRRITVMLRRRHREVVLLSSRQANIIGAAARGAPPRHRGVRSRVVLGNCGRVASASGCLVSCIRSPAHILTALPVAGRVPSPQNTAGIPSSKRLAAPCPWMLHCTKLTSQLSSSAWPLSGSGTTAAEGNLGPSTLGVQLVPGSSEGEAEGHPGVNDILGILEEVVRHDR
jgi:hypothetical protein